MAKFTQDMKDVFAKARPFILATADKNGKPNGVPIGLAKLRSDDEIMLVNVGMHKTWQNLAENPVAAVTFWGDGHYGYQCKGKAIVETSGELFDEAVQFVEARNAQPPPPPPPQLGQTGSPPASPPRPFRHPHPKGVVVVKVDEIYYIGGGKDPSINLAQQ